MLSSGGYLMVIGLNPSTADETNDDPTIRRCVSFAKSWGLSGLCMTNLFAWRDTSPDAMKRSADPIGADNDYWLGYAATGAARILAAWGMHGSHRNRARELTNKFSLCDIPLECLKKNKDGSPMHPLYVAGNTHPIPFP